MAKYQIREKMAVWLTYVYEVEADSEEQAMDRTLDMVHLGALRAALLRLDFAALVILTMWCGS